MAKRTLPKGIYLRGDKFVAQARLNRKQIQLGTFNSLEEAVTALDIAIGRAVEGLDSIKTRDKVVERLKTYKDKTIPHEDDELPINKFHLYVIVKASTPYSTWVRNASLPVEVNLGLAKRFLAKRDLEVVSMENFKELYLARLARLTEPWTKHYRIVGPGSRRNTLEVCCKGCGRVSLMRPGTDVVPCECDTAETILYFSRGIDGAVYVSIGPAQPLNMIGCLYVPRGAAVPIPAGSDFESGLDIPPMLAQKGSVLDKEYEDRSLKFLEVSDDDVADEDDLEAYEKMLESNLLDLDDDFSFDGDIDISKSLLEEDMKELSGKSSTDILKQEGRK